MLRKLHFLKDDMCIFPLDEALQVRNVKYVGPGKYREPTDTQGGLTTLGVRAVFKYRKHSGGDSARTGDLNYRNYSCPWLLGLDFFLPFKPWCQITNSPFVFPYISYRSSGEKLLKYQ